MPQSFRKTNLKYCAFRGLMYILIKRLCYRNFMKLIDTCLSRDTLTLQISLFTIVRWF